MRAIWAAQRQSSASAANAASAAPPSTVHTVSTMPTVVALPPVAKRRRSRSRSSSPSSKRSRAGTPSPPSPPSLSPTAPPVATLADGIDDSKGESKSELKAPSPPPPKKVIDATPGIQKSILPLWPRVVDGMTLSLRANTFTVAKKEKKEPAAPTASKFTWEFDNGEPDIGYVEWVPMHSHYVETLEESFDEMGGNRQAVGTVGWSNSRIVSVGDHRITLRIQYFGALAPGQVGHLSVIAEQARRDGKGVRRNVRRVAIINDDAAVLPTDGDGGDDSLTGPPWRELDPIKPLQPYELDNMRAICENGQAGYSGALKCVDVSEAGVAKECCICCEEWGKEEFNSDKKPIDPFQLQAVRIITCAESCNKDKVFHRQCVTNGDGKCPFCNVPINALVPMVGRYVEGDMVIAYDDMHSLPENGTFGVINITFNFYGNAQGPKDPSPGSPIESGSRKVYLPSTPHVVENLLPRIIYAYRLGRIFTIRESQSNLDADGKGIVGVVWASRYRWKTSYREGESHSWPDPTYLFDMDEALKCDCITEDAMRFAAQMDTLASKKSAAAAW